MIKISLLKNNVQAIPRLAFIWHEVLGKIWAPEVTIDEIKPWYQEWLNDRIPLAFVAMAGDEPVGACSLQMNDGILPDLSPWLGDLVVDPAHQNQGIGRMLIETAKDKAKMEGFQQLYLFTFSETLLDYYRKLGWESIGADKYHGHPVTVMCIRLGGTI